MVLKNQQKQKVGSLGFEPGLKRPRLGVFASFCASLALDYFEGRKIG